ncbi:hypothetical protein C8Q78DRAFT_965784 [Trametes maxima]|nr:hypothetical protein C8Q78DRAFT_965784 [Trametes maxima]
MDKSTARPPFDDVDADIIFRSVDGVDFLLYKVILAKASTVFRDMLTLPDIKASDTSIISPQVVHVTERAEAFEGLLRFCYPVERPILDTIDRLLPVLDAAKKYDMNIVENTLTKELEAFVDRESPLRIYAIACLRELPDLAYKAGRLLAKDPYFIEPSSMPRELHVLPAEAICILAEYRRRCIKAGLSALNDREWMLSGDHPYKLAYSNKGNPHMHTTWIWYSCNMPGVCQKDTSLGFFVGRKQGGAYLYPCKWWSSYRAGVAKALGERPDGGEAVRPSVIQTAVKEAARCTMCSPKAQEHLTVYAKALEKRIEAKTENVGLIAGAGVQRLLASTVCR